MIESIKKRWKIILFSAVILLAVFLRVWHFHDWLFFKMDQARDAMLVSDAFQNGPRSLPLLGPKAGGTNANVGPAFYYFQYLATVIFQSDRPDVMAYPDLLFSILSIFLIYFLFKKYFNRDWSMVLASAYALCFLGVQYSRFAWNPNSLPFFNILFFLSLLNTFDERMKYRLRWAMLAGFSFAISTQLHFLSFFTLPFITFIFLFFNRRDLKKRLNWKIILPFILIVFAAYAPVFFNELASHGHATKEFFNALHSKADSHPIWKKIFRDIRYFGQNWLIILTGFISKKSQVAGSYLVWIFFILPALFLNFRLWRTEKDPTKKNFLLITLIWFPSYVLAYVPIAYDIRPRFFLPMLFLPFAYAGYILTYLSSSKNKVSKIFAVLILTVIVAGNMTGIWIWFSEIKESLKRGVYPSRTIILKAQDGIVLWHEEKIADYMVENCQSRKIYYYSNSEYKRPVKYALKLKGADPNSIMNIKRASDGCAFAVYLTRAKKVGLSEKVAKKFDVAESQKFGAISVARLAPKEGLEDREFSFKNQSDEDVAEKKERIFWKDVFK